MPLKLVAIGGLGTMLGPSAHHLQHSTVAKYIRVLDRKSTEKEKEMRRQAWRKHGGELVNSLGGLLLDGDFDGVVVCAGKNGDDFEIFSQLVPMLKMLTDQIGRHYFILHLSTVSCDFVRATVAYCEHHQVQYANYPLTGGAKGAENAQMLILASGDEALYQKLLPMLELIGKPKYFGIEVDGGAVVKLIGHMMVFHGLLGISLAAGVHKNFHGLTQLGTEQVDFFDFLNKGAGGTRQWDVALRQSLVDGFWDKGFSVHHAVIDALYTVHLMLEKNIPRMLVLPLLEVILLFCLALSKQKVIATQYVAQLLAETPAQEIDDFLSKRLSWDVQECMHHCVAALPQEIRNTLLLKVRY